MSITLITLAADYVSHLLVQGIPLDKSLEHANRRFGIKRDLILAEIEARHAFALTTEAIMDDVETFDAAARWIGGSE